MILQQCSRKCCVCKTALKDSSPQLCLRDHCLCQFVNTFTADKISDGNGRQGVVWGMELSRGQAVGLDGKGTVVSRGYAGTEIGQRVAGHTGIGKRGRQVDCE